jgi:hypothetical protein
MHTLAPVFSGLNMRLPDMSCHAMLCYAMQVSVRKAALVALSTLMELFPAEPSLCTAWIASALPLVRDVEASIQVRPSSAGAQLISVLGLSIMLLLWNIPAGEMLQCALAAILQLCAGGKALTSVTDLVFLMLLLMSFTPLCRTACQTGPLPYYSTKQPKQPSSKLRLEKAQPLARLTRQTMQTPWTWTGGMIQQQQQQGQAAVLKARLLLQCSMS